VSKQPLLSVFFAAILVGGLVLVEAMRFGTVQASSFTVDSISKPSVPEFNVTIVSYPYDVPSKTTTTIDEYTGKETTTTQPGYHVENKSIEIIIKNQPFTPYNLTKYTYYYRDFEKNGSIDGSYTVDNNKTVNFYFNVQVKGHFGENWKSVGER
jgi:archaellum component FlaG (FlaF/FlaG flagellin family)